jgi:hypothetical protein
MFSLVLDTKGAKPYRLAIHSNEAHLIGDVRLPFALAG